MPTVSVLRSEFYRQLGTTLSTEELETLCFEFGVEYDGVEISETGAELLKIEVPANRYDLLCTEGLVSALLTYKWDAKAPKYRLEPSSPKPYAKITVDQEHGSLRPYIFAAILRDVKLNNESYKSLIDLQEKLHQNICRKRTIAAIGTHDLDSIRPPFTYTFERPEDIVFSPLTDGTKEYNARELLKTYQSHSQLKAYVKILENAKLYPVVRDSNGNVCSLPPIINSYQSRITLETRNIFVEVTATDVTKGQIVLNQIVSAFSIYCSNKFTIEPVLIRYDVDKITPNITPWPLRASTTYLATLTGIKDLTPKSACSLLEKMMISAIVIDNGTVEAHIPITRSDIQHPCDLGEDIAISYGYKNIERKTFNMGSLLEKTVLVKTLRTLFTSCSYKETLMPILESFRSGYENMNWKVPSGNEAHLPVIIKNSQVAEQEILRTTLIPGLLKTVFSRKASFLPIRIFEIGDVVWRKEDSECGAVNNLKCAAAYANTSTAGLEEIQGLSELLLNSLGFVSEYQIWEYDLNKKTLPEPWKYKYKLVETEDPAFLPGRIVNITMTTVPFATIGMLGIVHPTVLRNFNLSMPVSLLELDLALIQKIVKS